MPLSLRSQQLSAQANEQRKLCRDWLVYLMAKSPEKPATKEELRAQAMKRWGVSKGAFDFGWIWAIEDSGNVHWYEPTRKRERDRKTRV